MICKRCREKDHIGCLTADCCCGHSGSPVRPLSDAERQEFRNGTLTARVMPREAAPEVDGGTR
jgi:hypothetical protein